MAAATPPLTPSPPSRTWRSGRFALRLFAGLLLVLVVAAVALHLTAEAAYRRSFSASVALADRNTDAQQAHQLEPFNAGYATRAVVMQKWLHGSILLSQDAALPAMQELADAYRLDVGDQELLALFKKAQRQLSIDSNFKAHIQHAHEGPRGTLRPQDLLR
jgi:hypothetical protein